MKKIAERRIRAQEEKKKLDRERQIRAQVLIESGYSIAKVAETLGVSEAVVRNFIKKDEEKKNDD